jgi:F-type H+-transporting ATPase subunit a
MEITPDQIVIYAREPMILNATLLFTWLTMALLVGVSAWVTRRLSVNPKMSPWQNLLEIGVEGIYNQIREITQQEPEPYLAFVGTLFLFIVTSNLLTLFWNSQTGIVAIFEKLSRTDSFDVAISNNW